MAAIRSAPVYFDAAEVATCVIAGAASDDKAPFPAALSEREWERLAKFQDLLAPR
jgi:hypothetical protein